MRFLLNAITLLLTLLNLSFPSLNLRKNTKLQVTNLPREESSVVSEYSTSTITSQNLESRIEKFSISMPQIDNRQKNIQIYLPPDYETSGKNYPVFYLHDGEYLFNPPPEGIGDYLIDETLDSLYDQGIMQGMIVVGIEHDRNYSWSEYTPWINENMHDWVAKSNSEPAEGGETFAFLSFIVETLKPEVDSRYRTLTDREHTYIGGFCRGGLFPIIAGIKYPEVFSGVLSMSPAVWLAENGGVWLSDNRLIQYIEDNTLPQDVKFYIDIGTEEASGNRPPIKDINENRITYPQAYIEGAEALTETLLRNSVPEVNIYFKLIEGVKGTRDEWAKRFDEAVIWLVNDIKPEESLTQISAPTKASESEENIENNNINDKIEALFDRFTNNTLLKFLLLGAVLFLFFFVFVLMYFLIRHSVKDQK